MCSLVGSNGSLGLGPKNAIDSECGQGKASRNQRTLNLLNCRPSTSRPQQALAVEASLENRVAGETRRLEVMTITHCCHDRWPDDVRCRGLSGFLAHQPLNALIANTLPQGVGARNSGALRLRKGRERNRRAFDTRRLRAYVGFVEHGVCTSASVHHSAFAPPQFAVASSKTSRSRHFGHLGSRRGIPLHYFMQKSRDLLLVLWRR